MSQCFCECVCFGIPLPPSAPLPVSCVNILFLFCFLNYYYYFISSFVCFDLIFSLVFVVVFVVVHLIVIALSWLETDILLRIKSELFLRNLNGEVASCDILAAGPHTRSSARYWSTHRFLCYLLSSKWTHLSEKSKTERTTDWKSDGCCLKLICLIVTCHQVFIGFAHAVFLALFEWSSAFIWCCFISVSLNNNWACNWLYLVVSCCA